MEKLSWEFVFNTNVCDKRWCLETANDAAKKVGYQYFSWNGWVYEVDKGSTEILLESLK